jgi:hypothetical protein
MARPVRTNLDFENASRIINLPAAVAAGQPATFEQLNAAIEGISWKDSVRVATTVSVTLTAPGATIDGVTMASNDRFLVKDQSTASQNGIYIWNGAASTATRALDASTYTELEAAVVQVEEGTGNGGTTWRQTGVNGTIDSTAVTWVTFGATVPSATETVQGIAELATQAEVNAGSDAVRIVTPATLSNWTGRTRVYSQTFGDGSATTYAITHSLNKTSVVVNVFVTSTGEEIICDVTRNSVNQVTLSGFPTAPASSSLTVVVAG